MQPAPPTASALPIASAQTLLGRVLRNSLWLMGSSVLARAVNFGRTVLLARLLAPDDFGVYGLAATFVGFALIFGDVGVGLSTLYRSPADRAHQNTSFWMNLGLATALLGGLAALAPAIAALYARPELTWVLVVLAGAFWLQVAATVHRTVLRRDLRFRALAVVEIVQSVVLFAVAAVLALRGSGVWAFVVSLAAANAVGLALVWRASGWTPRWEFSRAAGRDISAFSGWYLGAAVVSYLALGLDRFLIGKFLDMPTLGQYVFAYDLGLALCGLLIFPLQHVVTTELVHLRADAQRFWEAYVETSRLAALVLVPAGVALVAAAPDLIPGVFGARWEAAVLPFQILTAYLTLRGILGHPFPATGRFDLSFRLGLAALVVGGLGILAGLIYGIAGVALAVAVTGAAVYAAAVYISAQSIRPVLAILRNTAPYAAVAAAASLAALGAGALVKQGWSSHPLLQAGLVMGMVAAAYAAIFRRELRGVLALLLRPAEQPAGRGAR